MKKNGFTLIELMMVLLFLILLVIIVAQTAIEDPRVKFDEEFRQEVGMMESGKVFIYPDSSVAYFPEASIDGMRPEEVTGVLLERIDGWQRRHPDCLIVDRVGDGKGGLLIFYENVPVAVEATTQ